MSLSIALDGNILLQLTEEARAVSVPVKFNLTYNEKVLYDFAFSGAVTNQAIPQGSVTNPRFILVWVREGAISLSWASDGSAPTAISANPTPPPTDPPLMMLMRYAPGAGQLYITTTAPARGAVWVLE